MSGLDLPTDAVILLLRIGMMALLYVFLISLFLAARAELRRQAVAGDAPGRLIVLDAGASGLPPGQSLPLRALSTLGRAPSCTVVLPDTYVSTTHAILTWRDGRWWLRDAGSTNGTLLNHAPVPQQEVPMQNGDVIDIGKIRLKLSA
jgi:hypothetical protein